MEKADLWINAHKAEFIEEIQGLAWVQAYGFDMEDLNGYAGEQIKKHLRLLAGGQIMAKCVPFSN